MQETDQDLIQQLCDGNARFRMLYEEHRLLEKELENFGEKTYLSNDEELEKKTIQKLKLAGKDEMEKILATHRQ